MADKLNLKVPQIYKWRWDKYEALKRYENDLIKNSNQPFLIVKNDEKVGE